MHQYERKIELLLQQVAELENEVSVIHEQIIKNLFQYCRQCAVLLASLIVCGIKTADLFTLQFALDSALLVIISRDNIV